MNERIKELPEIVISQNESEWPDFREVMTGAGALYLHVFSEKFAELIVQEMLRLLEQYSRDSFPEDTIDDFDKGYLAGLHTAQEAVKKHFGVEE